ncbi:hypothetical protein BO86DRAFT_90316 [Aspergillus japonicus CBS 114.51]|uniref:Uncharacterized protein n=2 Tax=Aspergillus TaxID=5052 RepID=A0A2V5I006_ASPV1|nr:hypothetical protein BO86DRAFT_90316 [Aspergillus japonicus CBS 114.51]PYI13036.1 hypothetical protein BO99DRAFT_74012 [Aspergillus violaceofuscus CBS 115571]RAH81886.1 hypothetical protein BO86DRAFT_90316 [Aspergillus japonicus CBS 114.51]
MAVPSKVTEDLGTIYARVAQLSPYNCLSRTSSALMTLDWIFAVTVPLLICRLFQRHPAHLNNKSVSDYASD